MWCCSTLNILNKLAYEQANNKLPERDALFVVVDPRRKKEFIKRSQKYEIDNTRNNGSIS
jgi:hypothetical protein